MPYPNTELPRGHPTPNTKHRTPNTEHRTPNTEYRILMPRTALIALAALLLAALLLSSPEIGHVFAARAPAVAGAQGHVSPAAARAAPQACPEVRRLIDEGDRELAA